MFKLNVLYENQNFIIIDKPEGLVVNRSNTSPTGTLQDLLEDSKYFSSLKRDVKLATGDDFISRTGIVHRIDKGTSGLLILALNEETFISLQAEFKARRVKKEYLAVILGKLPNNVVEIDAPLERSQKNRMKIAVSKLGKPAFTRLELLNTVNMDSRFLTLVKCIPTTGRTHQLRIHLCALATPIAGDRIYCGTRQLKWAREVAEIDRLMLHASHISFSLNGEQFSFDCPPPETFSRFLPIS